jgi:hypothetical protein
MPTSPPLTLEAFAFALNRNLKDVTRNLYMAAPAEADYFAKRESTDRWVEEIQNLQGIGRPIQNRDLEPLPQVTPITGYKTVVRQTTWRSQLTVEETLTRVSPWAQRIMDNYQDMMLAVMSLKDSQVSNFFNAGFTNGSAGNIVEFDGVARAFFSTGHLYESGAGTWSNYYNVLVPPNPETVYLIIQQYLGTLKDNTGSNYIMWEPTFTILTPRSRPDWGMAADEIVASQDRPDTANRAINVLNTTSPNMSTSFRLQHRSLNYLTSTTKWFITVSPSNRVFPLRLKELEPYSVTPLANAAPINPHAWMSTCRTQFGIGFQDSYRGVVAIGT